jgi:hypothetical protein
VGWSEAAISNCYSTGPVQGASPVGGLVGGGNGTIQYCYAVDTVSLLKGSNIGGLIGSFSGTVTSCFYNNQIYTGTTSYGKGKTTAEMQTQSTFTNAGWDNTVWNMDASINDNYPYLAWQNPIGTPVPVELTNFTATTANNSATLAWSTATEVNNYGFDVERRAIESVSQKANESLSGSTAQWLKIGFVAGNGTSSSAHSYSYTDANVSTGTYAYRLKQIDNSGTYKYSSEAEVTINVPTCYALGQNYPNPFNPSTVIGYQLPVTGLVTLKVYDVIGREVATLVNEQKDAGYYKATFNATKLASGVYFYRMSAGSYVSVKKLLLMK